MHRWLRFIKQGLQLPFLRGSGSKVYSGMQSFGYFCFRVIALPSSLNPTRQNPKPQTVRGKAQVKSRIAQGPHRFLGQLWAQISICSIADSPNRPRRTAFGRWPVLSCTADILNLLRVGVLEIYIKRAGNSHSTMCVTA